LNLTGFKNILNSELPSVTQKQNIPIITGVSLCILSVVVLLVFGIFESFAAFGVSIMLLMIAAAVFIFITSTSTAEAYKKLMKIDEYSPERFIIGNMFSVWIDMQPLSRFITVPPDPDNRLSD